MGTDLSCYEIFHCRIGPCILGLGLGLGYHSITLEPVTTGPTITPLLRAVVKDVK